MKDNKKLLILVEWFTPGYKAGGPIQSCVNLCVALKDRYDIYVFTTDTDHGEKLPYPAIEANKWIMNNDLGIKIFYAKKATLTSRQLASEIQQVSADYVYLNHLFNPLFVVLPLWLTWLGKIKSKVVVCPRGALNESALNVKRYKKGPLLLLYKWLGIQKKILFHATNRQEQLAIEKYFPDSTIQIADNLPKMLQAPFQTCKKKPGSLNCIFIARIVPIKNLLFLLQLLKQVKAHINLTIIGPKEDEAYWADCLVCLEQLPENIETKYEGAVDNTLVQSKIQRHHLSILPTAGENFGHSIFEAMLAGRPVLISDQTPWLNLQQANAGWDLPLNSPGEFASVIQQMALFDQEEFDIVAKGAWTYAHTFISNPQLNLPYLKLFA